MGRVKQPLRRYRMDNSAIVYPMIVTKNTQSIYALGVELNEDIDKNTLLEAVNRAFLRYPYFKVRIRYSFYRPYLEENPLPYKIAEDGREHLKIIPFSENNGYLFETYIQKNRIYMVFFHALCDANGGMELLKTVTYYYLEQKGVSLGENTVKKVGEEISPLEYEDSFDKYYKPFPLFKGIHKMAGGFAFGVREELRPNGAFAVNRVECDTASLLSAAHAHRCTVTVFLSALLAQSIQKAHDSTKKERYIFFIPVNYRKFFPSRSLYNFTGFARCIIPKDASFTRQNLCNILREEMKKQMSKEELQLKLSFSSLLTKNLLMKIFPFSAKRFLALVGRNAGKKSKQTIIVSNLGKVDFPSASQVNRFLFYLNCNNKTPENVGILSYADKTQICFSRRLLSEDTEKIFTDLLSAFCPCTLFKD